MTIYSLPSATSYVANQPPLNQSRANKRSSSNSRKKTSSTTPFAAKEKSTQNKTQHAKKQKDQQSNESHMADMVCSKRLISDQTCHHVDVVQRADTLDLDLIAEKLYETLSHETKKGISTTTLTLHEPDALGHFHQAEFTLIHYDTAPHSFNIHIQASEYAGQYFKEHLDSLKQMLTEALPDCEFRFHEPKLFTYKSENNTKKNRLNTPSSKKSSPEIETLDY